jgi:tetratricopeptide (TPR) repeat protein
VPAVVAMQDEVPVELARTLAADFYRRLFDHGQVDRALNEARSPVYERDRFEWATPVLFLRLRDGRLFAAPPPARPRLPAPLPPADFAGRVDEIERLAERLTARPDAAATVAIQGVGGQGKSALARVVGQRLDSHFPGGVLWVDVGPGADEPGRRVDLVNAIALKLALDLHEEPLPLLRERIVRSELGREGPLLAALDDVWEVDAGRWLRERVLPDGTAVLLSSRDLGVCKALASTVKLLSGLPVEDGLRLLANLLGQLGRYEGTAKELIGVLDGHPLALELAARQALGGPRDLGRIKAQLERTPALDILTLEGEERRDTSVARCFLLSYQRLDPEQQRRYRALGAFAWAPFDLAAVGEVWGDGGGGDGPGLVLAAAEKIATWLVRRGLLEPGEDRLPAGLDLELDQPVYAQHTLVQRYALALLDEAGERDAAAERHAAHYRRLPGESWQSAELFWAQVEHAWGWVDRRSLDERLGFLHGVKDFAYRRGLWEPARRRAAELLAELQASDERPGDQDVLLGELGYIASALGDKAQALEFYEQALPLRRQVGDRWGESITCYNIGMICARLGDLAQAERMLARTVELDEATGHHDLESDHAALEAVRNRLQAQEELGRRLLPRVREARDGNQELATQLAPLLEGLADQEDVPPELRILGRVLLQLLAGETSPDLSGLPPELAGAAGAAFDLTEP